MYFNKRLLAGFFALLALGALTACGGGAAGSSPSSIVEPAAKNVARVVVDAGPTGNDVNRLYTDVTICRPGSLSQCHTIDHVLVDTGSTGLRIFASELPDSLQLNAVPGSNGMQLLSCIQFLDNSFAWGPVVLADVVLGGMSAASMPIQVIADARYAGLSVTCASGTANDSVFELGAKGVLGVGSFKEDCGPGCASIKSNGFYYACSNALCNSVVPTTVPLAKQLQNPVAAFAAENNGFLIDLPPAPAGGSSRLEGSMVFGIGTQTNNQTAGVRPLMLDADFYVSTSLAGKSYPSSFIDTGSNGLYFDTSTLPLCTEPNAGGFYCPNSALTQVANLVGANGVSVSIPFTVSHAMKSFEIASNAVLPYLAGPVGDPLMFDWGLPFFFGRRVFVGIEGKKSTLGMGPYYAF